ncbi:hypothetical protein DSL72_000048 [Monilinia vaccinii-corymbosi]|uniref:phosphoethanolamine N-methyltransferase n=1 Tax=Monilinia vaccinii-corymbosi TaxID=61207 RepID=A0A8A3P3I1_9HELO|nr:hypothetical protein DSL72_000048 [Monilinia vaccinii-corymbosi]
MSASATDDETSKFYDSISDRYDKYYGHDPGLLAFIQSSLESLPADASVIDIGSGTGIPTALSVTQSGRKLHGIDISPRMIALARKNVPGGTFELANMLEYVPAEKYDGAFANFSLFHFTREEIEGWVGRLRGWIREGGGLFIGTMLAEDMVGTREEMYDEEKLSAPNVPHRFMDQVGEYLMYTKKGWEKLLGGNGFEIVKTEKSIFLPLAESDEEPHFWITARKVGA